MININDIYKQPIKTSSSSSLCRIMVFNKAIPSRTKFKPQGKTLKLHVSVYSVFISATHLYFPLVNALIVFLQHHFS